MLIFMANKNKQNELEVKLAEFRDINFSHNSAEEFLKFKGDSPNNYQPIYLSAAYAAMKNEDEKISQTELKLARKAVEKGCRYVTNLDYCLNCIAGTGLVKK